MRVDRIAPADPACVARPRAALPDGKVLEGPNDVDRVALSRAAFRPGGAVTEPKAPAAAMALPDLTSPDPTGLAPICPILIARADNGGSATAPIRGDRVNGGEKTSFVAFLEGIHAAEARRNRGFARALPVESEQRARPRPLAGLASPALPDNRALGVSGVGRTACCRIDLQEAAA